MHEDTLTLWSRADARRGLALAFRNAIGVLAVTRLPLGSDEVVDSLAIWAAELERGESEMREAEEAVARELAPPDPADDWLRDAMGR
jgi:hypothetical protein